MSLSREESEPSESKVKTLYYFRYYYFWLRRFRHHQFTIGLMWRVLCHCCMVGRARPSIRVSVRVQPRRAAALSYALKWENNSTFIVRPKNT